MPRSAVSWLMNWHRSGTRGWTLDGPRRRRPNTKPGQSRDHHRHPIRQHHHAVAGMPQLGDRRLRTVSQEPYIRKPRDAAGSGVQQRHEALPVPIAAAYSGVADLPTIHSSVRMRPPRGYGEQSVASAAAGQAIQATSFVMVRAR